MKTIFKTLSVVALMTTSLAANAQDKIIDLGQLPKQAQSFIKTYASKLSIAYIKLEEELFFKKNYEVKMKDGSEFEFDKDGNWKEVDLKHNAVPIELIPQAIRAYVSKSFPNNSIVQIAKNSSRYEVELSNGLDLEFNSKGKFLRIDD
ncbi:PepSY-like domain-containing protein [Sphingobacterium bovistauri]|uniref:PepSY-like domain-containing protein n=1 Tax=Sphingobacterium bovistauri TaxID=2781959 RepID=A0ABS7Z7F9_9SPHI|nr:PepSY-like domain-containing protein [Sphingobacterium bovistauri]MCA5005487.1 PepSY-like domain-containing protein [Sphingobacterium bovistauri]